MGRGTEVAVAVELSNNMNGDTEWRAAHEKVMNSKHDKTSYSD